MNFVPAFAYLFCLDLPGALLQPVNGLILRFHSSVALVRLIVRVIDRLIGCGWLQGAKRYLKKKKSLTLRS